MNVFNVLERVNVVEFIKSCKSKYRCASFSNYIESQIFKNFNKKFKINKEVTINELRKKSLMIFEFSN